MLEGAGLATRAGAVQKVLADGGVRVHLDVGVGAILGLAVVAQEVIAHRDLALFRLMREGAVVIGAETS